MLHSKVKGHGFPGSFQFGEYDSVYEVNSVIFGEPDAFRQPNFEIQELLAVDVFRDAEASCFRHNG